MYKDQLREYPLYTRNIWDYFTDILSNPYLVSQMDWDAYKMFRFDDKSDEWVRFYDDPLTGDRVWDIQVRS